MSWSVTSGPGPRDDAIDRFENAVATLGREGDREQATQCLEMARALDLDKYDEPIELIADGHVHILNTVPSWVRLQVSTREAPPEDESVEVEDPTVTHVEGGDAADVGDAKTTGDTDAANAAAAPTGDDASHAAAAESTGTRRPRPH